MMTNDEIEAVRASLGFIRSSGKWFSNRAYHIAHNDDPTWEKLVAENRAKKRHDRYGWVIYHPTIECARTVLREGEYLNESLWEQK